MRFFRFFAPLRLCAFALNSALSLAACGSPAKTKAPGRLISDEPRFVKDVEPTDLFPADLDLVVRIDLARMRAGLGPSVARELAARALAESGGEEEVRSALACAE